MTRISLILLAVVFLCSQSYAQTVKKVREGYQVKLESVDLPKQILNKSFKSGIKTDLFYTVSLVSKNKEVFLESGSFDVRYDLWDEVFKLRKGKGKLLVLKDLSMVYHHIEDLSVKVVRENLEGILGKVIKIRTLFLLNPVDKEKSKKIKEWIAERNVGKSSIGRVEQSSSGSVFSGIVNRLVMGDLDKDIYGADKKFIFLSPEIDLRKAK